MFHMFEAVTEFMCCRDVYDVQDVPGLARMIILEMVPSNVLERRGQG